MTSPARLPLLPSVFKPDDTADAESSLSPSSPRLKPWQKRRTTSTSSPRPRLSPVLKSVEPVAVQRAGAERDDTVRPVAVARSPKIALTSATPAGPSETRPRWQKQDPQNVKNEDECVDQSEAAEDADEHKAEQRDNPQGDDEDEDQPEVPYPEVIVEDEDNDNANSLAAPPNFRPFFTVLEDSLTGEVYHPATYYIFADDDPALVTAASMRALGVSSLATSSPSQSAQHPVDQGQAAASAYADSELLPAPRPGVQERYIIIDVGPDGQSITGAQSLSGGWAVTKSVIAPAPSFGGHDEDEDEGQTMMLKIDGLPISVSSTSGAAAAGKGKKKEARVLMEEARKAHGGEIAKGMEEIVKGIRKSVLELDKIVDEKD